MGIIIKGGGPVVGRVGKVEQGDGDGGIYNIGIRLGLGAFKNGKDPRSHLPD